MKRNNKSANAIDKHVAKRMKEQMKEIGMTQMGLAAKIGVTFQQVQKYVYAKNRLSAGRLFQIAGALGRPVEWFFQQG